MSAPLSWSFLILWFLLFLIPWLFAKLLLCLGEEVQSEWLDTVSPSPLTLRHCKSEGAIVIREEERSGPAGRAEILFLIKPVLAYVMLYSEMSL